MSSNNLMLLLILGKTDDRILLKSETFAVISLTSGPRRQIQATRGSADA